MGWSDDDFEIGAYVPGAEDLPDLWQSEAQDFRAREAAIGRARLNVPYGEHERQKLDLFHPAGPAEGLVVFIHGGYWVKFDRGYWSHYAEGLTARGWAVAMPSYRLAPEVRVSEITSDARAAVEAAAALVRGPIRIAGHSAGGHLTARMGAGDLSAEVQGRIVRYVPISPLADLRPLVPLERNSDLRLDAAEAEAESPVLHAAPGAPVSVWVGSEERPVFLAQAEALAQAWGAAHRVDPGRNHFDILDGLRDPESPIVTDLLA